ncbi:hypothetical protein lbkm_1430 [Lachnospiraceae bacterium KM106-2]|nr:hypothetical protein lbkm_1430 [Lachnospiraceae bacterium KM106-2]
MTIQCPACKKKIDLDAKLLLTERCPHCKETLWKDYDKRVKNMRYVFQTIALILILISFKSSYITTFLIILACFIVYLIMEYISLKTFS